MKNNSGFTLLETFVVLCILAIFVGGIVVYGGIVCTLCKGNFWVGNDSALSAVKLIDANAKEVVSLERRIYDYSIVSIKESDGTVNRYLLDADILQNVTATKAVKPDDKP